MPHCYCKITSSIYDLELYIETFENSALKHFLYCIVLLNSWLSSTYFLLTLKSLNDANSPDDISIAYPFPFKEIVSSDE